MPHKPWAENNNANLRFAKSEESEKSEWTHKMKHYVYLEFIYEFLVSRNY